MTVHNLFKNVLMINLLFVAGFLCSTTIYGAELASPSPQEVIQTAVNKFSQDPFNFSAIEPCMRAGLLTDIAYQAALSRDYPKARRFFDEASARGGELAIRYLAKSYKHGDLLTGFDKAHYEILKQKKSRLAKNDEHRAFLGSFIKIINQRLEAAFYVNHPQYDQLVRFCQIPDVQNQPQQHALVSPYLVVPQLIEKYLTTSELDQCWDSIDSIITELNSDQLYERIRQIINAHIRNRTSMLTDKECVILKLVEKYAKQKELIEKHFIELRSAMFELFQQASADEKEKLFQYVLEKIEFCYKFSRELVLHHLNLLLMNADKFDVRHYCILLNYARKKDLPLFYHYAVKYRASHLADLMQFALATPHEMAPFKTTILSVDNIINEAFEQAKRDTVVEALRCFFLNGSHLFNRYSNQIETIFPILIHHRYRIFDGILALLRSAEPILKTYCFETIVEKLANLEWATSDSDQWIDQLLSQDLSGINGDSTPLTAYNYCFQKFTEKNAQRALQLLRSHFPQYA